VGSAKAKRFPRTEIELVHGLFDFLLGDAPLALANHSITYPVTKALACIDNGWSIVNRSLIWDDAAPVVGAIAFTASLLAAQGTVQVAA